MFMYMWEYHVKSETVNEFEEAYGAGGDWVKLFQQAEGYLGTELHRAQSNTLRYVTIDYWASKEACAAFRKQFCIKFQQLDEKCESLTEREMLIGNFDSVNATRDL